MKYKALIKIHSSYFHCEEGEEFEIQSIGEYGNGVGIYTNKGAIYSGILEFCEKIN